MMPMVKKEGLQPTDRSPPSGYDYLGAMKSGDYPKSTTSTTTTSTGSTTAPNSNELALYPHATAAEGMNPPPLPLSATSNQPLGHYAHPIDASAYTLDNSFKQMAHHSVMPPGLNTMNSSLAVRGVGNPQDMMKMMPPTTTQYQSLPTQALPPTVDDRWAYYQQSTTNLHAINPEREAKWAEVKRYSDAIRRHVDEGSQVDLSREKFIDLYNLIVTLLRAVDNLDPDKSGRKSEAAINALIQPNPTQAELDFLSQSRKSSFDYFRRNSFEANAYAYGAPVRYVGDMPPHPYYANLPYSTTPIFHPPSMPVIPPMPASFVTPQRYLPSPKLVE
eukprot:TRINITY_DN1649_c0_g3_i3.p1 TRINITY_DN1649_c0_g3~~TRINITY_DN1649_c0_g3_i3.p1  ORF type:complete len:332 (-),score=29.41 TRINITY_DN1649_c0_g3_i3:569-1564(-)